MTIPRRQVRGLLYYLAAQPEASPRERLCFLFWPDMADSSARRNLTHLLTHLRGALPDRALLLASPDWVGLDPHRISCDVASFRSLAREGGGIEAHRQAVALYRGPFLAGFSLPGTPEFDYWALQRQREYERVYLGVLSALIEEHASRQEYYAAIDRALEYLSTDELAEDIHRRLIALYAARGNRSAALHQFERCTAVLERELGVSPLPETRAIYESALRERPVPAAPAARALAWATLPGLDVPLVGRDGAWRELRAALSDAQAGRSRVLLISGEPGIGKSRLMEEFATRSADGALVLAAAARSQELPLPYHPAVKVFRSLPSWEPLTAVEPLWLAEAARLLPELHDLCPRLPPPVPMEPDEARARLLEALCRLTLALTAAHRPLLLCLDDLHWADSATLDWLLCLITRTGGRRIQERSAGVGPGAGHGILVIGTYRTAEGGTLQDLRHNLVRLRMMSELRLRGLTADAILGIVHHLTGPRRGAGTLAARLHRATGGNPFFVLEAIRVLLEAGELPEDLATLDEVPLPDTVREAVAARLRQLDPRARQVLEAGAVLGPSFGFDLVRHTAGRGELETIDALDEAVAHQLLVEDPPDYRFRHALIRQTVETGLGPVRRHLLHRRAAQALEQVDPQATTAIARHFDRAGEAEKALDYYRRAARQGSELFAWRQAEAIHSRMLELLEQLDPRHTRTDLLTLRGEILTDRAHMRFLQGRLEERDADLATLAALAEMTGDQELGLQALVHRVRYLNLDARYEEALTVAEGGLKLAAGLCRGEASSRLLAQMGFAHYFLGQPRQALAALESALATAGEEASPAIRGRIAHILGYVYFHLGDYCRSLSSQQEAYACHQATGDLNRMAWDGLDIGAIHLRQGDLAAARKHLSEHLDLARRIGASPAEAYGMTLLGSWELHQGGYLAAADRFREARSAQRRVHSEHGIVASELGAGLALYHLGKLAHGRRLLQSAIERASSIAHRRRLAECHVALGLLEIGAGSPAAARPNLIEGLGLARDGECWESVAAGLTALARLERASENLPQAVSHARDAIELAQSHQLRVIEVWAHIELGLALLAQGNAEQALAHTSHAVDRVNNLHEAWIGSEEVHGAQCAVLQALRREDEAHEQARLADAAVQAKADRIPDPTARERYLSFARPLTC